MGHPSCPAVGLAFQATEEVAFLHVVFEGFSSVHEDHGNLVPILAAQFGVVVDVDFAPVEGAAILQAAQGIFHHVAEMASGPRIDHDFTHVRDCILRPKGAATHRFAGAHSHFSTADGSEWE
jgi:hypothetical protein